MFKRIRTPLAILAISLLLAVALFATNVSAAIEHGNNDQLLGDLRILFATAVILAAIWIAVVIALETNRPLRADVTALRDMVGKLVARLDELDEERTQALPRPRLSVAGTVVATAVVRQPPAELPPDNVRAFELGRKVERDTRRE